MDCTYSFFVACYFAINDLDCVAQREKGQVWALDATWLSYAQAGVERIKRVIGPQNYVRMKKRARHVAREEHFDETCALANAIIHFLVKKRKGCVYNVTPFRLNERLVNQHATFLLQGDITRCFIWNLKETIKGNRDESANHLYRIVIDLGLKEKKKALYELDQMGINQAVLFPDLRGFAESLIRRLAFRDRRVPD